MLIGSAKAQSCKPILSGKHSLCVTPPILNNLFDYKIENFIIGATYSATVTTYQNGTPTSTTFSVTSTPFTAFTYNPNITAAIIILQQLTPCTDADTIYVQPCCNIDPSATQVIDIAVNQIPNIQLIGQSYIYDPIMFPNQAANIDLHGQLLIDKTLEIRNATVNVDQGGSIMVESGQAFAAINTTIKGGCNHLWQGIHAEDQSEIKLRNGSIIQDAEYGLFFKGTVVGDFNNTTAQPATFINNYIAIYSPENSTGNTLNFDGSPGPGINITRNSNLLSPYFGQKTITANTSYAGFFLKDVSLFKNHNSVNTMRINISNMNIGIAAIRSSLDLQKNVTITNTSPNAGYSFSSTYNGSAIYCEGNTLTPQSLTFGNMNNTSSEINSITTCLYAVFANRNINVNVVNNDIDNVIQPGNGVRVSLCGYKNITINNNRFDTHIYIGIYCAQIPFANLSIEQNTFNTGPYWITNANLNLANTAIRVFNKSIAPVYGHINNNQINSARIGIYVSDVKGFKANNNTNIDYFQIENNNIQFTRNLLNYIVGSNIFYHFGIIADNSGNLSIRHNNIYQTQALSGAPQFFENYSNGIRVFKTHTGATLVENNTISGLGTGIEISDNCIGTTTKCNLIYSSTNVTFPRGIYLNYATITNQGNVNSPTNNGFLNFSTSSIAYKISGTLNVTAPIQWFASANTQITPFNVIPIVDFLTPPANIPGPDYCGFAEITTSLDAIRDHVHQVVYNELIYEIDSAENRYMDLVYAYRYLLSDSDYLNSDITNQQFISDHSNDNIGNYVAAEALRNNDQISEAILRLNSLVNLSTIEENIVTTERIALLCEMEFRSLNDSEIIILNAIADQNAILGGDGVINARAMLDKEIYGEQYFLRKRNNLLPSTNNQTSAAQIENKYAIELIRVTVVDEIGRSIYIGSYTGWKGYKLNTNASFVTVKYYFQDQPIGSEKHVFIK